MDPHKIIQFLEDNKEHHLKEINSLNKQIKESKILFKSN